MLPAGLTPHLLGLLWPASEAPESVQEDGLWEMRQPLPSGRPSCPVSLADLSGRGPPEWPSLGSIAEPISWQCDTNGHRIKTPRPVLIWTATGAWTGGRGSVRGP